MTKYGPMPPRPCQKPVSSWSLKCTIGHPSTQQRHVIYCRLPLPHVSSAARIKHWLMLNNCTTAWRQEALQWQTWLHSWNHLLFPPSHLPLCWNIQYTAWDTLIYFYRLRMTTVQMSSQTSFFRPAMSYKHLVALTIHIETATEHVLAKNKLANWGWHQGFLHRAGFKQICKLMKGSTAE